MVFAGTTVTKGIGIAIVTNVLSQNESEMGKILSLLDEAHQNKKKTPLQKMLKRITKVLIVSAVVLAVGIPVIYYFRFSGSSWSQSILFGLSLAFAIIPEELPILIKAVLAVGSLTLSKRNLLIKNLHSAELLGTVTTIITGKKKK